MNQPQTSIPPIKLADGNWARDAKEKANAFANNLQTVFKPFPSVIPDEEEATINNFLDAPFQMDLPIKNFKYTEVKTILQHNLNPQKSPGFDQLTGNVLMELPDKCVRFITIVFNAILRNSYFPDQWKVAQIILIPKEGKPRKEVQSYEPISLLPILSKVLEKLILKRLQPSLEQKALIPNHQFRFRRQHATIEQIHRVVSQVSKD